MIGAIITVDRNAGCGELRACVSSRFAGVAARGSMRARELAVERRQRQRDLGEPALRHRRQDVDVARHQRRFRDDADRDDWRATAPRRICAHDAPLPLDRLIGIGVGADRDRARLVARRGELLLQKLRGVGLGEQLRLEIEPRRKPHIGVRRPREAVGAAVLAAAIGVDRAVEGNVGRLVAGDDLARLLDLHLGAERRQLLERAPFVVEGLARLRLVAAGDVGLRAAPVPAVLDDVRLRRPARPAPPPARRALREAAIRFVRFGSACAGNNSCFGTNQERIREGEGSCVSTRFGIRPVPRRRSRPARARRGQPFARPRPARIS